MVNHSRKFFLLLFFFTFQYLCHGSSLLSQLEGLLKESRDLLLPNHDSNLTLSHPHEETSTEPQSTPPDQTTAHSENADHEKTGRSTKFSTMSTVKTSPTIIPNAMQSEKQQNFQLLFGDTSSPNGQDQPTSSYPATIGTDERTEGTYDPMHPNGDDSVVKLINEAQEHSDGSERSGNGDHSTIATITADSHKLTEATEPLNSTPKEFTVVAARSKGKVTQPTVSTKKPNVHPEHTNGFLEGTGSTNVNDSEPDKDMHGPESLSSADQKAKKAIKETQKPNTATPKETEESKIKVTKEIERPYKKARRETEGPRTSTLKKSEGANTTENARKGGATTTKENAKPGLTEMKNTTAASEHSDGSVDSTDQYQEATGRVEHAIISKQPASHSHSQAKGSAATHTDASQGSENEGRILTTTEEIEDMIHTTTKKSAETARPTDSSERPKSMYHSTSENAVGTAGHSDPSLEKSRITATHKATDLTRPNDGPEKPESMYHSTGLSDHSEMDSITASNEATGASEPTVGSERSEKVYTAKQSTGAIGGSADTQRTRVPQSKGSEEPEEPTSTGLSAMKYTTNALELTNGSNEPESENHTTRSSSETIEHADVSEGLNEGVAHPTMTHITGMNSKRVSASGNSTVLPAAEATQDADGSKILTTNGDSAITDTSEIVRHANSAESTKRIEEPEGYVSEGQSATKYTTRAANVTNGIDEPRNSGPSSTRDLGEATEHTDDSDGLRSSAHSIAKRSAKTSFHEPSGKSHSAAMPTSEGTKDANVTGTASTKGHPTVMGTFDEAKHANATETTKRTDSGEPISQDKSSTKDTTNAVGFTGGAEEPGGSGQSSTTKGESVNTGVTEAPSKSAAYSTTKHITAAKSDEPSGDSDSTAMPTTEVIKETGGPESSSTNDHVGTMSTTVMADKTDSSEKSSINSWSTAANSKGTLEPKNGSEQPEINEHSTAPSSEDPKGVTDHVNGFQGSSSGGFSAVEHNTEATDYSYSSSISSDSANRHNTGGTGHTGGSEKSTVSTQLLLEYSTDVNEHIDESEEPSNNDHSAITKPSLVTIFTEDSEKPSVNNWSTRDSMETAEATSGTGISERSEQPTTSSPTRETELTGSYKSSRNIDISSVATRDTTESIEFIDSSESPDSADDSSEDTRNTTDSVNYTESSKATISGDYSTTAKASNPTDSTGELRSISYASFESTTKAKDVSGGTSATVDLVEDIIGATSQPYGSGDPSSGTYPPLDGFEPQTEYNNETTEQPDMSEGSGSEVPSISTSIADESTHQYPVSESYTTTATAEAESRKARTEKYTTDTSYSAAADETESFRTSSTEKHSTEFVTATGEHSNTSEGSTHEQGSTTESSIEPGVSENSSRTPTGKGHPTSQKSSTSLEHQPGTSTTTIPNDLAVRYSTTAKEHGYVSRGSTTDSGPRTENSAGTTGESSSHGPTHTDRTRSTKYRPNYTVTESKSGSTEYGSRSERSENDDDTATKHTTKQSHVSAGLINDGHSTTRPTAGPDRQSFNPTSPQGHPTGRPTDEGSPRGRTVTEKTIATATNRTTSIRFIGGAYLTTDNSIILLTSEKSKSIKRFNDQNSKANATVATHHKDDPGDDAHYPTKHGTRSNKGSVGSNEEHFTKKKKATERTAKRPQDSRESFSTKRGTHSDSNEQSEKNHSTKKATVRTTKRQNSSKSDKDDDSGKSNKDRDSHESSSGGYSKRRTSAVAQLPRSTRGLQKGYSDHNHVRTPSTRTVNLRGITHKQNNMQTLHSTEKTIHKGSTRSKNPTHTPRPPTTKANYRREHGESPGKTSDPQVNVEPVPNRESPLEKKTTSKTRAHTTTTTTKKTTTPVKLMQAGNKITKSPKNGCASTTQRLPCSHASSVKRNITKESVAVTSGGDTQTSMPSDDGSGSVTQCPQIEFDLSNSLSPLPSSKELSGPQPVGTMVVHMCAVSYVFPSLQQPLKIYECLNTGKWTDNNNGDKCEYVAPRKKNSADL